MDVKKEIKSLLNQAEVYKSQGLFREALEKYIRSGKLIQKHQKVISNHKSLLNSLAKKVRAVKEDIQRFESIPLNQEMPESVLNIIKQKFAVKKEGIEGELEGAVALAKFGQYERALDEFKQLVKNETVGVDAAKNIIRCHMALDSVEEGVKHYRHWCESGVFVPEHVENIRRFFQERIDRKKLDIQLQASPGVGSLQDIEPVPPRKEDEEVREEDLIDITTVVIALKEGRSREFDVSFQSGTLINLLLSDKDTQTLEQMEEGLVLENVQFFSPIAMFEGKARVESKSQIDSGPKMGYYSVDLKIMSI